MTLTAGGLVAWLADHGEEVRSPVAVRRVGAGQSNATSLVEDASGRSWVLRRPPAGSIVHDVSREARILVALAGSPVPVPTVVGTGEDEAGLEGPFLVMHRAPGEPLETERDAAALHPRQRAGVTADVVDILAALHELDPESVGLGDLGAGEGYLERQLRRTARMWDAWGAGSDADTAWRSCLRSFQEVMPDAQRTAIVHGDYRLSNLLVSEGRVRAVLDWELCTLGDPLVDLAWLLDDWRSPHDPAIAMPSPTRAGGFPTRDVLRADYARRTRLDLSDLDRYRAYTHWRAGTLLQGVLERRRGGALGDHAALAPAELERTIHYLFDHALTLI